MPGARLRADDDRLRLSGVVLPYGTEARIPGGRERIMAGAFGDVSALDVVLNVHHDRGRPLARTGGGGLRFSDSDVSLDLEATLPETREAEDVVRLVRAGVLRGLSVEFMPTREERVRDVLEVLEARLLGVGVVDRPAYPAATVSARRRLLWL
ncbi:HK97 family phage prohead protease [Candidatus Palauibacter sp.]|uniref:HK97 family phage prohead protease n=1 Tax=Candidatus Palauibacter sp. TaxID=3101350 RepID=UPI003B01B397